MSSNSSSSSSPSASSSYICEEEFEEDQCDVFSYMFDCYCDSDPPGFRKFLFSESPNAEALKSTLERRSRDGVGCFDALVRANCVASHLPVVFSVCSDFDLDLLDLDLEKLISDDRLNAFMKAACKADLEPESFKSLFEHCMIRLKTPENVKKMFLQPPIEPECWDCTHDRGRGHRRVCDKCGSGGDLLYCALRYLWRGKLFKIFWNYFHVKLNCFEDRPDLLFRRNENGDNLLEQVLFVFHSSREYDVDSYYDTDCYYGVSRSTSNDRPNRTFSYTEEDNNSTDNDDASYYSASCDEEEDNLVDDEDDDDDDELETDDGDESIYGEDSSADANSRFEPEEEGQIKPAKGLSVCSARLIIDFLHEKGLLRKMLLHPDDDENGGDDADDDDARAREPQSNRANKLFQRALESELKFVRVFQALDYAFRKCGVTSVDFSSSLSSVQQQQERKNRKCDDIHNDMNDVNDDAAPGDFVPPTPTVLDNPLAEYTDMNLTSVPLAKKSMFKWKAFAPVNFLQMLILLPLERRKALLSFWARIGFLQDLLPLPCQFLDNEYHVSPMMLAVDSCKLGDDSEKIGSSTYSILTKAVRNVSDWSHQPHERKCLAMVNIPPFNDCSNFFIGAVGKEPTPTPSSSVASSASPSTTRSSSLASSSSIQSSPSSPHYQNKAHFTIPNLQRIVKYAVRSPRQVFELAYISSIFQETMIDYHTAHTLFKQMIINDDIVMSVWDLDEFMREVMKIPWIAQEVLLLPTSENQETGRNFAKYEWFLNRGSSFCDGRSRCWKLNFTCLCKSVLHAVSVIQTRDEEGSYKFFKFCLAHTPDLPRKLKCGSVLLDSVAKFKLSERNVELLIHAYIETGVWRLNTLFGIDEGNNHRDDTVQDMDRAMDNYLKKGYELYTMGVWCFLHVLVKDCYSAVLLKKILDLFPGTRELAKWRLLSALNGSQARSHRQTYYYGTRSVFMIAFSHPQVSADKLKVIVDFLTNFPESKLDQWIWETPDRELMRCTHLNYLFVYVSSVEKIKVIIDAVTPTTFQEIKKRLLQKDSCLFCHVEYGSRDDERPLEDVVEYMLDRFFSDDEDTLCKLLQDSYFVDTFVDCKSCDLLQKILNMCKQRNFLRSFLEERTSSSESLCALYTCVEYLTNFCYDETNPRRLLILLKAYADCGMLNEALVQCCGRDSESSLLVYLLSYYRKGYQAEEGNEIAGQCLRVIVAHFESNEQFLAELHPWWVADTKSENSTSTATNKWKFTGWDKDGLPPYATFLLKENILDECRDWFRNEYGMMPAVNVVDVQDRRRQRSESSSDGSSSEGPVRPEPS